MALKPAGGLDFPFKYDSENDCLLRTFTIETTLIAAIRCFVITRKGSRLGNNIGSFLPELLLTTIPTSSLGGLASQLKQELTDQFPGVEFLGVTFIRENVNPSIKNPNFYVSQLRVTITFTSPAQQNITDLILELPSVFDSGFKPQNYL